MDLGLKNKRVLITGRLAVTATAERSSPTIPR